MHLDKQRNTEAAFNYLRASYALQDQFPECATLAQHALQLSISEILKSGDNDKIKYLRNSLGEEIFDSITVDLQKTDPATKINITKTQNILEIILPSDRIVFLKKTIKITSLLIIVGALLLIPLISLQSYFQNSWKASYFTNPNLLGQPLRIEYEPIPNHTWNTDSPFPEMAADDFSVRWESILQFDSDADVYFFVNADDGVRLFVDEKLIIDEWYPQYKLAHKKNLKLKAGKHAIKLEYYEGGRGAEVHLEISAHSETIKKPVGIKFLRPKKLD